MMTGTYSDAQTVEQGAHIHVMNITNQEADNGILALLLTKKPDSIDSSHLLHTVAGEFLLVLGNVIHAERRNIIDGFCQTMGSYIIRSTSLELERQLLESSLLETYALNHFATALIRRQLVEPFFLAVKHTDTGRTINLMSAESEEITIHILYIHSEVRSTLSAIHHDRHIVLMSYLNHLFYRIHRTEHVAHLGDAHDFGAFGK